MVEVGENTVDDQSSGGCPVIVFGRSAASDRAWTGPRHMTDGLGADAGRCVTERHRAKPSEPSFLLKLMIGVELLIGHFQGL
jgi:hypothetical protein